MKKKISFDNIIKDLGMVNDLVHRLTHKSIRICLETFYATKIFRHF